MKKMTLFVALAAVTAASEVRAETNPLSVAASTDGAWALSFETSVLPKGWFNEANQFTRTKTTLTAEVTALAGACSNAAQSDARVSSADGSVLLGTTTTPNGKNVTGYYWQYGGWDLTNLRNSYSIRYLCDGTTEIRGCDATRAITLTVNASDKSGLRTYTDDAGVQRPVTFTVSGLSLPAYHDAASDQYDDCTPPAPGEPNCGIGTCQSACVASCASGQAGKSCREACECTCKVQVYEATGGVCHAKDKCLEP